MKASLSVSDKFLDVVEGFHDLLVPVRDLFTDIGLKIIQLVDRLLRESADIPARLGTGFGSQQKPDSCTYRSAGEKESLLRFLKILALFTSKESP